MGKGGGGRGGGRGGRRRQRHRRGRGRRRRGLAVAVGGLTLVARVARVQQQALGGVGGVHLLGVVHLLLGGVAREAAEGGVGVVVAGPRVGQVGLVDAPQPAPLLAVVALHPRAPRLDHHGRRRRRLERVLALGLALGLLALGDAGELEGGAVGGGGLGELARLLRVLVLVLDRARLGRGLLLGRQARVPALHLAAALAAVLALDARLHRRLDARVAVAAHGVGAAGGLEGLGDGLPVEADALDGREQLRVLLGVPRAPLRLGGGRAVEHGRVRAWGGEARLGLAAGAVGSEGGPAVLLVRLVVLARAARPLALHAVRLGHG